jgi:hypothetical protein
MLTITQIHKLLDYFLQVVHRRSKAPQAIESPQTTDTGFVDDPHPLTRRLVYFLVVGKIFAL